MVKQRAAFALLWCGAVVGLASCAFVAGLGDYELAHKDASLDVESDGPAPGESSPGASSDGGDATPGDDAASASEGGRTDNDTGSGPGSGDAAPDASGPTVPPSDKGHVSCGKSACSLPFESCCQQPDGGTCQTSGMCNGGAIARCDEAANCPPTWVCCVTGTKATGLETSCQMSCQKSEPQSCRTTGECGAAGPCVAWTCAGSVVATCGGAGASPGCQ